jgi:type IV secretion system protein VirB4
VLLRKPTTGLRPPVLYELRSVNLANLPEKEQASVLDRFASFLDSLTEPITFHVVQDEREVEAIGALYHIPYKRFFLETHSQVDSLVQKLGTRMVRVHALPQIRPTRVYPRYIVDSEGHYVQTYCITRLGGTLVPGFLAELYQIAYSIMVDVDPIDNYEAKKMVRSYARSVGSRLLLRQNEGRSLDPEEQAEFQRASGAAQLIGAGKERLFRTRIRIVLRVNGYKELVGARKKLRQLVGGMVGQIDSPAYLQQPLLTGIGPKYATGRWFFIATSGALSLFPFCGLDVVDPSGVFFGQNLATGNAILYDVYEKDNYNIAVMGMTGLGKSTLVKTLMSRMALLNEDMMLYAFDSIVTPEYAVGPDGSYESSFAGLTKCHVHRFDPKVGAGLDPFRVFGDSKLAASFIADILDLPKGDDLDELHLASRKVSNVEELYSVVPASLKKKLDARLPPYEFLFKGETQFYDKMVFVLNDIPNPELRDAAAFLSLSAVWSVIKAEKRDRKKAVIIDEGWALVEKSPRTGKPYFPMAVDFVPEIARTGRHHNACFLIATQLVSDFMGRGNEVGPGRQMVESCATKIVLRQDEAASATLKEAFRLSEVEEKFVVNARIGQGILVTPEGRMPFYNLLSDEERRLFTTKPKEVTA